MGAERRDLGTCAPITEALIDLQVTLPTETTLSGLESLHESFRADYPEKQQRKIFKARINLEEEKFHSAAAHIGWVFTSADKLQVLQLGLGALTYSRLQPYASWSSLLHETRRFWQIYSDAFKPTSINRIAVRFINQLTPPAGTDFDDFFTIGPRVPDGVEPRFKHYQSRIHLGDSESQESLVSLSAAASPIPNAPATVTLDIDTFQLVAGRSIQPDSDEIWEIVDALRDYKNTLFFGSMTEEAIEFLMTGDGGSD